MTLTSLTRIVFGWAPPDAVIANLQAAHPDIEIVVATGDSFIRSLPGAEAAVAWSMTPEEYTAATSLRWFQSVGAGVERVLLPGMRERGLVVTNTSGIHASNISEHVLAMMFAFARRLPFLVRAQLERSWKDDEGRQGVFELEGQTLLVVGYGEIGQALGRKAAALGMRVLAVKRTAPAVNPPDVETLGLFSDIPRLVAGADHVAICLPQTANTVGLFDAAMLSRMKPGAYIYNIGRGPIIDTAALVDALDRGHLGGAGLDVTEPEPLQVDSPLWDRENVLITMHTAGSTPDFWTRIAAIIDSNIRRFRAGEPLMNVVDYDSGY
jgi:D-2-hydroxyacid dehydrogenase (NADP+)